MKSDEIKELILREKLVAIFRHVPVEQMSEGAKALVRGGVRALEITFDQQAEDPLETFRMAFDTVRTAVGDALCLGAGTVLTEEQVRCASEAGAAFIVAPNTNRKIIAETKRLDMVSVPGAMTPTEIAAAWDDGADIVKLFPADDLGYHYIWNLRGPLPHIPLMVSGGVNTETIPKFFCHGASVVSTGVSIMDRSLLEQGNFQGIEVLARAHVDAVHTAQTKDN